MIITKTEQNREIDNLGIGNVDPTSSCEYNFHGDPEAAHVVLKEMQCPLTVVPWEAFFLEGPEVGSRFLRSQNNFTKSLPRCLLDYKTNIFQHEKLVDFHAHLNYETPVASYFRTATSIGIFVKIFPPENHFDFRPRETNCIWTSIRLL